MRAAVRKLPDAQREAVVMAYWGGLTADEIARRIEVPLGTAKSRIRLGLEKLRSGGRGRFLPCTRVISPHVTARGRLLASNAVRPRRAARARSARGRVRQVPWVRMTRPGTPQADAADEPRRCLA